MDSQEPSLLTPTEISEVKSPAETKKDSHGVTIAAMAAFVLLTLATVAFLYYQNQELKKLVASLQTPAPTATPAIESSPAPTASPSAEMVPIVTSPKPGSKVTSPLTVTGTVPPGWMFEGVFPIKLVDSKKKLIVAGQGREVVAGSWQSGNPVKFTAKLTFTTEAESGFLILENDNPSGDQRLLKTLEIPVVFNLNETGN